jgi:hypothetical protein
MSGGQPVAAQAVSPQPRSMSSSDSSSCHGWQQQLRRSGVLRRRRTCTPRRMWSTWPAWCRSGGPHISGPAPVMTFGPWEHAGCRSSRAPGDPAAGGIPQPERMSTRLFLIRKGGDIRVLCHWGVLHTMGPWRCNMSHVSLCEVSLYFCAHSLINDSFWCTAVVGKPAGL